MVLKSVSYPETWALSGFEPRTVEILGLSELMMANFRQLNFKREEMRVSLQCDPGERGEHPLIGSAVGRERL